MVIALYSSHIHAMETLQARQSPLFDQLIGQWLRLLPFASIKAFLLCWSAEERVGQPMQ